MKIIAIETELPGVTSDKFTPEIRKAEAEKAWQLQQAGIIRELYFQKEQHIAVLILECADETEAKKYLSTLPLVKEKLIRFDLIPLLPYDGFSRLFSNN
ncbi:MAG: superoxide dismutase [Ignavibacteriales bacterium]|nr:MAG: superoxide dismutase [Ignavibacteriales bacterium]